MCTSLSRGMSAGAMARKAFNVIHREHQSHQAADEPEHDVLGENLPRDAAGTGADRRANRHLA